MLKILGRKGNSSFRNVCSLIVKISSGKHSPDKGKTFKTYARNLNVIGKIIIHLGTKRKIIICHRKFRKRIFL